MTKTPKSSKKVTAKKISKKPAKKITPKVRRVRRSLSTCLECKGAAAFTLHKITDMVTNDAGKLVCVKCGDRPAPTPVEPEEELGTWYVLQVDPGSESQVRTDILKAARVRNLGHLFTRIMTPSKLVERVGVKAGEIVAEGTAYQLEWRPGRNRIDTYRPAKEAAAAAAQELFRQAGGYDDGPPQIGADAYRGFKVQVFPGKIAGTVEWKVRRHDESETTRRVVKGAKYPGYMFINMEYNEESAHIIKKTRNTWGLLLQPVVTGHNIKLSERKPTEDGTPRGWNWRVCEPDGGKCVGKGWAWTKEEARAAAEIAKSKAEEFKPTRLADEEACEALVAQKAVNQIMKDKEELNKAVCNLRPGDTVRGRLGIYRGCRGNVDAVIKNPKDSADVSVKVTFRIMGTGLTVTLPHFELERTQPGDRDD